MRGDSKRVVTVTYEGLTATLHAWGWCHLGNELAAQMLGITWPTDGTITLRIETSQRQAGDGRFGEWRAR